MSGSTFPAVPGSSMEPEKNAEAVAGELIPARPSGLFIAPAKVRAADARASDPLEGELLRMEAAPLGVARPFADPAQESALAPLFRDFARIFGGSGS